MKKTIISNNVLVHDKYNGKIDMIYLDGYTYLGVLELIRDKIHQGHKLLTHPLSGSVKPNETPYKSAVIGSDTGNLDLESLEIIEDSIKVAEKFIAGKKTPRWTEEILEDFKLIDFNLIDGAIQSMNQFY